MTEYVDKTTPLPQNQLLCHTVVPPQSTARISTRPTSSTRLPIYADPRHTRGNAADTMVLAETSLTPTPPFLPPPTR